jgi:hypothetical protein
MPEPDDLIQKLADRAKEAKGQPFATSEQAKGRQSGSAIAALQCPRIAYARAQAPTPRQPPLARR